MDKRAWWAIYSPWGYKELDKTGHNCVKVSFTQVGSCFFFFGYTLTHFVFEFMYLDY